MEKRTIIFYQDQIDPQLDLSLPTQAGNIRCYMAECSFNELRKCSK